MKLFFNHRLSRTTLTNVRVGRARTPAAQDTTVLYWRLFDGTKRKRKLPLMLACMLCTFAVNAATWYVDAANGSDENAGTSWETSLASIQSAVDKASDGDTILVGEGDYTSFSLYGGDSYRWSHTATEGYKILSIKSIGRIAKTTINGGQIKLGTGSGNSALGNGTVEGFTIIGGSFSVNGPGKVNRCVITGMNGKDGTYTLKYCNAYNSIFYGNSVYRSEVMAAKLYNCTIYENHGKYIAYDSSGSALYNCIYYGDNLGVYDGAGGAWRNYAYNCFSADPKFVDLDAGDFRLLPTSPCIDAGNNSYATSDDTDVAGKPRINGGTVDIGAYEYYPVELSLKGITAKQRYPWNGKVDVQFKLETSDSNNCVVMLFAKDVAGGTNLPMRTVYKLDGSAVNVSGELVSPGTYHWVWDAAADLPKDFKCERVTVEVKAE